MEDSVTRFYDELAADYHLLFDDWQRSVVRQGEVLDRLLRDRLGERPLDVLDCCCGIGTQALGLALRGHRVHATDLSPAAVARARREAEKLRLAVEFGVADLRELAAQVPGSFDAALACDNALPHLLTDDDLHRAVGNMASRLRPGGLFVASVRDYDDLARDRPASTPLRVFDGPEGRRIVFQVWDWSPDGHRYRLCQFIVRSAGGGWETSHYATDYRALLKAELAAALVAAGLSDVTWHPPTESGFYQPLVTARRPGNAAPPR